MTKPIINPVLWSQIQGDMSMAERRFADCLSRGVSCVLGNAVPETADDNNTVRAEVIRFFAYGGNEANPVLGASVHLKGAWISGDGALDLAHAAIPYGLVFFNCRFTVRVVMLRAACAALYMSGSRLTRGLHADGLKTEGDVHLRDGFSAEGEVRLLGANIGGNLSCTDGKFHNPKGNALNADGLTTKGSVHLRDDFSAEGEARLLDANIGGNLDCTGGKFHNPEGNALSADGLTTKGTVHLRDGFSAEGEVRLLGANIGGDLSCTDGKFHNPKGNALNADGLTTKGAVHLCDGFFAEGEARLLGANIGGNLDCTGGKFHNPKGNALNADRLTTKGTVNLCDGFSAEGEVRLLDANIGGNLDCRDGEFGNGLNAENVQIGGFLGWRQMSGQGLVNFGAAKASVLADDMEAWELFSVALDGFAYDQFADPIDAQFRIAWLAKRTDKIPFSPQPYEQAAKVLHTMGRPVDAWDILREKRRLERKRDKAGWLQRAWGRTIDTLTDFVYRPLRTVKWTAGVVLAGALAFGAADYCGRMVPHQPIVLAKAAYQDAREVGMHPSVAARAAVPDYPGFNPLVFSLDVFVPLFNLHQEPYWAPDSGGGDLARWRFWREGKFDWWWLLTAWYWIEIMAGWLLTSLLLLSVTGLLRPRIGGGD